MTESRGDRSIVGEEKSLMGGSEEIGGVAPVRQTLFLS